MKLFSTYIAYSYKVIIFFVVITRILFKLYTNVEKIYRKSNCYYWLYKMIILCTVNDYQVAEDIIIKSS